MEFRNHTKDKSEREIEDGMDGLIEANQGHHPKLATDFPRVILEEDIPGPVAAVETKIIDPNAIAAAATANSGITNTTGLYYNSDDPTPFIQQIQHLRWNPNMNTRKTMMMIRIMMMTMNKLRK